MTHQGVGRRHRLKLSNRLKSRMLHLLSKRRHTLNLRNRLNRLNRLNMLRFVSLTWR